MEDWKIKVSVLWVFASIAFLAHQIIVLMEPYYSTINGRRSRDQKKDPLIKKTSKEKKSLLQESLKCFAS